MDVSWVGGAQHSNQAKLSKLARRTLREGTNRLQALRKMRMSNVKEAHNHQKTETAEKFGVSTHATLLVRYCSMFRCFIFGSRPREPLCLTVCARDVGGGRNRPRSSPPRATGCGA